MGVVEDDQRAPRSGELRQLGHHRCRLRRVMKEPRGEDDVRSATDGEADLRTGELALDQGDVRVSPEGHAFLGPLELSEGAIDPDDAFEGRCEDVEEAAVTGACVDR